MPDFSQAGGIEPRRGFGADSRQPAVRERVQKLPFPARRHLAEGGRLVQLRGDLADEFVRPDAFADGDFERLADGFPNGERDFRRRLVPAGGQVKITFINGRLLDFRGEIVAVTEHPIGKLFVTLEIAGQHDEFGAELARPDRRHRRVNAEFPGLVGSRGDDAAAFAADGYGFAAQPDIGGLFHGREESIRIQMNDEAH